MNVRTYSEAPIGLTDIRLVLLGDVEPHPGEGAFKRSRTLAAQGTSVLQDTFLKHLRDNKIEVTIFLANGIRLQGQIRSYDSYTVQLVRGGSSQVIFKHAISAINPAEPIQLAESHPTS